MINTYPVAPPLFVTVTPVLLNVTVAVTLPLVSPVVEYDIAPTTGVLSILVTTAIELPVFHARSLKVKAKLPFPVNVCDVAFTHVNVSLYHVSVTITS